MEAFMDFSKIVDLLIGLAVTLVGGAAALFPQKLMKEEFRNDEKKIAGFRSGGIIITIFGVAYIILMLVL